MSEAAGLPGAEAVLATSTAAARVVRRARGLWRRAVLVRTLAMMLAALLGVVAALALLDLVIVFPPAARRLLRLLPLLAGALPLLRALRQLVPGPDDRRIALLVEERHQELDGLLSTALEPIGGGTGEVARAFLRRAESRLATLELADLAPFRLRPAASVLGVALVMATLALALTPDGGAGIWRRWARLASEPARGVVATGSMVGTGARLGGAGADEARHPGFGTVRVFIEPPAYSGLAPWEWTGAGALAGLPGSRVRVQGALPGGTERVVARVIGGREITVRNGVAPSRTWTAAWTIAPGERGLSLEGTAAGDVVSRRVLPLTILTDDPPLVELDAPAADLVVAMPRGESVVRARARDDYGVGEFELAWIRSRGSGESFSFDEGRWEWTRVARAGSSIQGEYRLDLGAAGLEPGDVVHLRAVARDRNTVTGPGEGVSRTRVIRVARAEEMAEATTLVGFPIEAEREPVLSQRMVILLTERLLAAAPSLTRDSLLAAAAGIADEQARLRRQVGDQALAPTTGAADSQDDGHDHDHDADPVLAVNRPLLQAYNVMWSAEGELRLAELKAALPYQYEALRILQEARQAQRVFLRGRVQVAPIDLAAARGTGKLDDAAPAPRAPGGAVPSAGTRVAELEALLARLMGGGARSAALELAGLAARLLGDQAVDPAAAALVARAAEAAEAGEREEALRWAREARARLAPASVAAGATKVPGAVDPRSAAYLRELAGLPVGELGRGRVGVESGGAGRRSGARDAATATTGVVRSAGGGSVEPFVFATLKYESGDWDSAPLVPANLIHSVAQYTEIPVAPEGVVVELASAEVFRYPILYLTGHLPVRFNDAESRNLEAYVERGGLVFIDDHNHDVDGAFHRTVTAELARIFGAGALEPLPNDHELYRSFFIFEDGPPTTSHELNGWGDGLIHEELFAIERGGRIGVLYSNKDYSSEWSYHAVNKRFLAVDNTKFGVNLIVYGLTR